MKLGVVVGLLALVPMVMAEADIIINEVMANEPGSDKSLEWIEFYNTSGSPRSLAFYSYNINGVTYGFPTASIGPYEYFIVCAELVSTDGSPDFESTWGNDNDVWDPNDPGEDIRVFEESDLNLLNGADTVVLYYSTSTASVFGWDRSGLDGVSWERYTFTTNFIDNSVDPRGATPGEVNSITPRQHDLALENLEASVYEGHMALFIYMIVNKGVQVAPDGMVSLYYDPDNDGEVDVADLIVAVPYTSMAAADTSYFLVGELLDGVYARVLAMLPDDDREENNAQTTVAPGEDFPPVIVTEFLPDPVSPLSSEWVELYNRSTEAVDLDGWMLGDKDGFVPISAGSLIIDAGDYLVLCQDSTAMSDYYATLDFALHEPPSWRQLNNNEPDAVILIDEYTFTADSLRYENTYGDNHTWAFGNVEWGWSSTPGGTPGAPNDVLLPPSAPEIRVTVTPNPFSLSRDGSTTIAFAVPEGEAMTVSIYDREGRVVKTFYEDQTPFEYTLEWDGTADSGRRLPAGIYILYVEVFGADDYKQTIVVAP